MSHRLTIVGERLTPHSGRRPNLQIAANVNKKNKPAASELLVRSTMALGVNMASVVLVASFLSSGISFGADDRVDYLTQVKPVFRERCFACHGAFKQEGSLRLDTAALAIKGGDSGAAIKPGDADASLLLERVTANDEGERMPPEGEPLKPEQIAALREWISQQAEAPADEQPERDPLDHWAFKTPVRPAVPRVDQPTPEQARWQRNPIDAFIASVHRKRGLVPQAEANKRVWLRRVSFDLIGLPPTREELDAFIADQSSEAYDRVVSRLLASPRHGERWGRHWMDIWRYSDWHGLGDEVRFSQRHVWRWRNWIIESVNEDKSYDRMIVEMLAGDEVAPHDPRTLRATGFLSRNWHLFNRNYVLDDIIEHTGKAFLGITLNCARCHDHMYDPFSQEEYYSFRAFFEPHQYRYDRVPGQPDLLKDGLSRAYDAELNVNTYLFIRGNEKEPDRAKPLAPRLPRVFGDVNLRIQPIPLPVEASYPALRSFVQREMLAAVDSNVAKAQSEFDRALTALAEAKQQLVKIAAVTNEAPNDAGNNDAGNEPTDDSLVFLTDDFSMPRAELWKIIDGQWHYEDGALKQHHESGPRGQLRTVLPHPSNFAGKVRFRIRGGTTRSVGMMIDADTRGYTGIFMSPSGRKVQVYHILDGKEIHPSGALKPIEVNNDQIYELKVVVQGQVIDVWIDGVLQLSYTSEYARREGSFGLTNFRSETEFLGVDIRGPAPTPQDLRRSIRLADQDLEIAEKQLEFAREEASSLRARFDAEQAKYKPTDGAGHQELARVASRAQRQAQVYLAEAKLAKARRDLSAAEQNLSRKSADKQLQKTVADANHEFTECEKKLASAKETLTKNSISYEPVGKVYPNVSSGRRLALARWIVDRQNPLTARVAVNHIWTRHFGAPLVSSPFDFGLRTKQPLHRELLDWLAVEFVKSGWDMKSLHRIMVTSQAYRRQSSVGNMDSANIQIDPDNLSFWRMNTRRMEGEVVRDSLLHVSRNLDSAMGGPDIANGSSPDSRRRSVYYRYARDNQIDFLTIFDGANVEECYRRHETVVPQQALALINSKLSLLRARDLAAIITQEVGVKNDPQVNGAFVTSAFESILGVTPSADELTLCRSRLDDFTKLMESQGDSSQTVETAHQRARASLVHALFNHHDFVTIR